MLLWPMLTALGFVVLAALVVALATSSTERYEFERNQVQAQRRQAAVLAAATPAAAIAVAATASPVVGAGQAVPAGGTGQEGLQEQATAVGVATHPAGRRLADPGGVPAWWLVDVDAERVVSGPFADRIGADWAALAEGLTDASAVHGVLRADGAVTRRQLPEEREWLSELGDQLDRLAEDWDERLTDDDAVVTLVVEVAAALVEAGLPVHDCAGDGASGGVCLTPEPAERGVLVSWHQHDRMSRDQVRGAATDAAVQRTMNAAVTDCLAAMGFEVEPYGVAGCSLVVAAQPWW